MRLPRQIDISWPCTGTDHLPREHILADLRFSALAAMVAFERAVDFKWLGRAGGIEVSKEDIR